MDETKQELFKLAESISERFMRCAFCRARPIGTGLKFIKGTDAYICYDCVGICEKIIAELAGKP